MEIPLGPLARDGAAASRLAPLYNATEATVLAAERGLGRITEGFTGRVFDGHAPDPSLARVAGGDLHAYVSNNFDYARPGLMGGELLRVPLLTSHDGVNFIPRGDALTSWPAWVEHTPDSIWAPFVEAPAHAGGEWRMYFTGLAKGTRPPASNELVHDTASAMIEGNGKRGIGFATSTDGISFTPHDHPLLVSSDVFDGIDPFVAHDANGTSRLLWGSAGHPIRSQQLSKDGARLLGNPIEIARPAPHANQGYTNLIEGAEPIKNPDNSWSLLVSGDDTLRDHYNVSELRADNPLGPFQPIEGARTVQELPGIRSGPGHHESIVDDAGQRWMYLHAYDHDAVRGTDLATRKLHLLRMDWSGDRWAASIPTSGGPTLDHAAS